MRQPIAASSQGENAASSGEQSQQEAKGTGSSTELGEPAFADSAVDQGPLISGVVPDSNMEAAEQP